MTTRPNYYRVFLTFARNSLVRDLSFRASFLIDVVSSMSWTLMNLGFYKLIFNHTPMIGRATGWGEYEFYVFLSTTLFANSLVQALFMPNVDELSDLIRTGDLDFALLKPIDTQFLVSLRKIQWSSLSNSIVAILLISFSLWQMGTRSIDPYTPGVLQVLFYVVYVLCGVAILYSLMIALASAAVWLGRNQSLYDFWFYVTNFSRYPMEIYSGKFGAPLRATFTYVIPILVVVNVPARLLVKPFDFNEPEAWQLPLFTLAATAGCLLASRWVFQRALVSYRSASS